jgi:transposase
VRGRQGGRPKRLSPHQRELLLRLHQERQHSIAEICQILGISKSTLYNYLAEPGIEARYAA